MYSCDAKSYLIPLLITIFLTPGIFLAFLSRLISFLLLLSSLLQSMQLFLLHLSQSIPYIFALGPPKSSMLPVKLGILVMFFISLRIDSSEREIILEPCISCTEQKLQLPMQPL